VKKFATLLIAVTMVIGFSTLGLADAGHGGGHKMVGEIVKIEGPFVTVKDKDGKSHKFHVNKSTDTKGKVKMGSKVEVKSTDSGHALSMHAVQ